MLPVKPGTSITVSPLSGYTPTICPSTLISAEAGAPEENMPTSRNDIAARNKTVAKMKISLRLKILPGPEGKNLPGPEGEGLLLIYDLAFTGAGLVVRIFNLYGALGGQPSVGTCGDNAGTFGNGGNLAS